MNLDGFKQYLIHQDCSKLTIEAYCHDMTSFSQWFANTNSEELFPYNLTSTDVREFKQFLLVDKHARPATINRKLASIRMYVNWAIDSKQIEYNPISGIKSVEEEKLSPRWLSRLEQAALLRESERRIYHLGLTIDALKPCEIGQF